MMKWIRNTIIILVLLFGLYALVIYYTTEENKSFTIEKEIAFPIEKVYPQFSNLQNFVRWNSYFSTENNKDIKMSFFLPYEGEGSAMRFLKGKDNIAGELYIRYENPNKGLKYQLFEPDEQQPFVINVKFITIPEGKTKIIWNVNTPKLSLLERYQNIGIEDTFAKNIDRSIQSLSNLLANRVDRDEVINRIKYDSIITEDMKNMILLGVNSNATNKKDRLFSTIIRDYNKVNNFTIVDLGKREDEIGYPILITSNDQWKSKNISYFIGVPFSKKMAIADNNFVYRDIEKSQVYSIYYKGKFENRMSSVQKLMQQAKKDARQYGDVMQTFLQPPQENKDVIMKFSLPIYK